MSASGLAFLVIAKNIWQPKKAEAVRTKEKVSVEKNEDKSSSDPVKPADVSTQSTSAQADEPANPPVNGATSNLIVTSKYPLHKNISTTYFWAGEEADGDNKNISNLPSAWDEDWVKHFGGVDNPDKRNGYLPAGFTPKENPFYFALPYNDFDEDGNQKNDPEAIATWSKGKKFGEEESMCKNQWIAITKNGKTVYAQWEDVGPFGEDDKAYVFGNGTPKSKENKHAGLDVSPAVRGYLSLEDIDKTDWQFVDAKDVPDGPWKNIITTSQTYWK